MRRSYDQVHLVTSSQSVTCDLPPISRPLTHCSLYDSTRGPRRQLDFPCNALNVFWSYCVSQFHLMKLGHRITVSKPHGGPAPPSPFLLSRASSSDETARLSTGTITTGDLRMTYAVAADRTRDQPAEPDVLTGPTRRPPSSGRIPGSTRHTSASRFSYCCADGCSSEPPAQLAIDSDPARRVTTSLVAVGSLPLVSRAPAGARQALAVAAHHQKPALVGKSTGAEMITSREFRIGRKFELAASRSGR